MSSQLGHQNEYSGVLTALKRKNCTLILIKCMNSQLPPLLVIYKNYIHNVVTTVPQPHKLDMCIAVRKQDIGHRRLYCEVQGEP